MSLDRLLGQPIATQTLQRALAAGRLHHAYRFAGPAGVGKETAAFLLAQALLCEQPTAEGGCGACSACHRVVTFSSDEPATPLHPDLVLVQRGLYPATLLGGASEATGISVEQIRRIVMPRVGFPPHEGRALVIVIRDAEELTNSAANALLKTLEEPKDNTHFVLLTSRPRRLLDTIVSRTLAIRFGALPDSVMQQLVAEQEDIDEAVIPYSLGSLERARQLSDPEILQNQEAFLQALDRALADNHPAAAVRFAEQRPEGRGDLRDLLGHAASTFALRARGDGSPELWAQRHQELVRAAREVEANASPALVLESMVTRLQRI